MQDRVPLYPGRVKLTPVSGQENTFDMTLADSPSVVGTALNKANLLSDEVAKKYFWRATPTLADMAVGDIVKLNVNGVSTDFLIVHQGNPDSSMYDSSFDDGTILLMKDCCESRQWHTSASNIYANSTIHSYLNSTFLGLFDSDIQSQIKQVKIPYVNGNGSTGSVASGSSGLSAKIFLLSAYEMGWTNSENYIKYADGAKLDYFDSGTGIMANNKRIANLNGTATGWWLRSPVNNATGYTLYVYNNGYDNQDWSYNRQGVRPALVLPNTLYYDEDTIYIENPYPLPDTSETTPSDIFSILSRAGLTPTSGNGLVDVLGRTIDLGCAKIQTGSYVGTGTYGESNPCSLTFDFEPIVFFLTTNYNYQLWGAFIQGSAHNLFFSPNSGLSVEVRWSGKRIVWYSNDGDAPHGNIKGASYFWTTIG